jgi:hypothetical protein
MRYLVGFVVPLVLVGSPLSVSAQGGQEAPAVEVQLDEVGVQVVPRPPRTVDGYTLEEMQLRVKRARIGLLTTTGVVVGGAVLLGAEVARGRSSQDLDDVPWRGNAALVISGMSSMIGGAVGMIVTGTLLGARKDELRSLQKADYGRPHRVQWDLARSRLVF